jgi:hypothetical protein
MGTKNDHKPDEAGREPSELEGAADRELDEGQLQRARQILDTVQRAMALGHGQHWAQIEAAWRALHEPPARNVGPPAAAKNTATVEILQPSEVPAPHGPSAPDDLLDRTDETASVTALPATQASDGPDRALPFKAPEDARLSDRAGPGPEGGGLEASTRRLRPHVLPFKNKPVPLDVPMPRDGSAPTEKLAVAHVVASPPARTSEPCAIDEEVTRADETTPLGRFSPLARPSAGSAQRTASWLPPPHETDIVRSPIQSLEGYAAFAAEIQLHPERLGDVRRRYGIADEASHQRLDGYWHGRFAREAGLHEAWEALHAQARDRLLKRGG